MKGQVLNYDQLRGEGLISAEDGQRYTFAGVEWKSAPQQLRTGTSVDFSVAGSAASAIYAVGGASGYSGGGGGGMPASYGAQGAYEKSNVVAGLLALFLGPLGIHKFYLGYNTEGVILLVAWVMSWVLLIVLIGFLGLITIPIITFIEAIIYLTKSPAEFQATYVEGRKPWF